MQQGFRRLSIASLLMLTACGQLGELYLPQATPDNDNSQTSTANANDAEAIRSATPELTEDQVGENKKPTTIN